MSEADIDNEDQLLRFMYACPVGLLQTDLDGAIEMLNPVAMQLMMPLTRGAMPSNLFGTLEAYAPELRQMVQAADDNAGPICTGHRIYVGHFSSQQGDRPFVLACTLVKLDRAKLIATIENISERVSQERRLKQAEVWFSSLLEGAENFAVIGLDASGCIEVLNASARQQTGFEDADLVGSRLEVLESPDPTLSSLTVAEEIELARRDGWHLAEGWCARRSGERYRCQRLISVCRETESDGRQEVTGYTVILRPVSKGGVDVQELRRRLTTDQLTGACNRAHFFEIAEQDLTRCVHQKRPIGLLVLDVDHFKKVNDTYGHAAGDEVLVAVANACSSVLRRNDTFGRLGGEEFVTLMPGADATAVIDMAERMRLAVSASTIAIAGQSINVTASIGGVADQVAAHTINELVEAADRALYEAKRNGRDRVVMDGDIRAVA